MSDNLPTPDSRRIILTGASGVGKTSLAELLATELDLPVIPELGRSLCQAMGYQKIGDIPDQEGFKKKVLETQIEEEEKFGNFISDRSAIDCWVLWQRWNMCSAMTEDTERYYKQARAQARKYTFVIYIPPMFEPVEDGFRWTDPFYQKQIDRLVRTTLYDWSMLDRTYIVRSDKVQLRLQEVNKWLANLGHAQ